MHTKLSNGLCTRLLSCYLFFCHFEIQAFSAFTIAKPLHSTTKLASRVSSDDGTFVHVSRRRAILSSLSIFGTGWLLAPLDASASASTTPATSDPVATLALARETLQKLLDNWEKAVIDCTFADVPRELLEQKNKEELLEKASTFALFDKSVSVETCKTTNRVVRDYLGATGALAYRFHCQ